MDPQPPKQSYAIPLAIIAVGALIAGTLWLSFSSIPHSAKANAAAAASADEARQRGIQNEFRLPHAGDHIRGNPEAPVTIVEFGDFECPFCGRLHTTLERLVREDERVRWVYRHFPLSIHANAERAAVASECAARLGGNDAFWSFADAIFANQRSLGTQRYINIAANNGMDVEEFTRCLSDNTLAHKIAHDNDEAVRAGGRGTPFAVLITPRGELMPFSGALPYDTLQRLVHEALER